ncbi:hypothetical protein TNCV_1208931 [Trichonephila clavipes]|nr:hypothetical protein TNCV_1208931 [Trichonephila clavipes]
MRKSQEETKNELKDRMEKGLENVQKCQEEQKYSLEEKIVTMEEKIALKVEEKIAVVEEKIEKKVEEEIRAKARFCLPLQYLYQTLRCL